MILLRCLSVKLNIYEPPYQDEWILSYFLRILRLNVIDLNFFEANVMQTRPAQDGHWDFEITKEFKPFCEALGIGENISDLYLSTSLYPFRSIFFTPKEQAQYMKSLLHDPDADGAKAAPRSLIKHANICPVCMQADWQKYGEPYFHRAHQLPGVCYCPTHHVKLITFAGHIKDLDQFDISKYVHVARNIPEASGIAYAEYAQRLFTSGVASDVLTVKAIIRSEFDLRGYKNENLKSSCYKGLAKWAHSSLFDVPVEQFSHWLRSAHSSQTQNLLGLLMFLFPDPSDLIKRLRSKGKRSFDDASRRIKELVGDDYELLEYDQGNEVMTLRHSCGMISDIPASSFFRGRRCAQCCIFPSYSEIKKALAACSDEKYASPSFILAHNRLPVLDKETNETTVYSRYRVVQELSRPTPSELFPDLSTGHRFADWHEYLRNYPAFLALQRDRSSTSSSEYQGMDMGEWCKAMRAFRQEGKLSEERIRMLSDAGFQW